MRIKINDIIEIETAKGLAYAIYTHRNPSFGSLIRVFEPLFTSRPTDFCGLVKKPLRFSTFFPVQAAVNQGIVEVVGNTVPPKELRSFPLFRNGAPDFETGKVKTWWLWDGEKEWPIGKLTREQYKLPILAVWNDTLLVERIECNWRVENEVD